MLTSAAGNQNDEKLPAAAPAWPGSFDREAVTPPRCNMISMSPPLGEHRFLISDLQTKHFPDADTRGLAAPHGKESQGQCPHTWQLVLQCFSLLVDNLVVKGCHRARSGVSAAQAEIWIFIFRKD